MQNRQCNCDHTSLLTGRQDFGLSSVETLSALRLAPSNASPVKVAKNERIGSFQAIDRVVRRVGAKHLRQDALLETKVFYANASPLQAVAAHPMLKFPQVDCSSVHLLRDPIQIGLRTIHQGQSNHFGNFVGMDRSYLRLQV
jgi:hypothetical protein